MFKPIVYSTMICFYFIQIRGSIPLYWSQRPTLQYKPRPQLHQADHVSFQDSVLAGGGWNNQVHEHCLLEMLIYSNKYFHLTTISQDTRAQIQHKNTQLVSSEELFILQLCSQVSFKGVADISWLIVFQLFFLHLEHRFSTAHGKFNVPLQ